MNANGDNDIATLLPLKATLTFYQVILITVKFTWIRDVHYKMPGNTNTKFENAYIFE